MNTDSLSDCTYYEGFWSFRNEKVEVLMDEASFDTHLKAYLVSHGIDTRTQAELLEYAAQVNKQRHDAEAVLFNPEYWLEIPSRPMVIVADGPTGSKRNKRGTSRKPPVFWTGPLSGAGSVTPSERRQEPGPSHCENATTKCTCTGPGSCNVASIKRCRACALWGSDSASSRLRSIPRRSLIWRINVLGLACMSTGARLAIQWAVALVINRPMKKRGKRWKRVNGTAVVALRAGLLNYNWITSQRLRAFP